MAIIQANVWLMRPSKSDGQSIGLIDIEPQPPGAHFERNCQVRFRDRGNPKLARVDDIQPPDWEKKGIEPTVRP